jgi:hypothetical protein
MLGKKRLRILDGRCGTLLTTTGRTNDRGSRGIPFGSERLEVCCIWWFVPVWILATLLPATSYFRQGTRSFGLNVVVRPWCCCVRRRGASVLYTL